MTETLDPFIVIVDGDWVSVDGTKIGSDGDSLVFVEPGGMDGQPRTSHPGREVIVGKDVRQPDGTVVRETTVYRAG